MSLTPNSDLTRTVKVRVSANELSERLQRVCLDAHLHAASFRGARKAVDGWLQSKRWTAHARQANAYMEARGNPKEGAAHDQIGSFHVWKAQPFEHARPFDLSRWPTRMVPTGAA